MIRRSGTGFRFKPTAHSGTYMGTEINTSHVAEPSTLLLALCGLGLFAARRHVRGDTLRGSE